MLEAAVFGFALGAAVLALLCAAALVEVFRQLVELRGKLEIDDQPLSLEFQPRELPAELVPDAEAVALVFLHARCGTCRLVAEAYRAGAPAGVWFVLPAADVDATPAFAALVRSGGVLADEDERLAEHLAMDVAPAVVAVRAGMAVSAAGVSNVRQLRGLLADLRAPDDSHEAPVVPA